jgi:hypothetical protein
MLGGGGIAGRSRGDKIRVQDIYYSVASKNAVSLQSPKSRSKSSKRKKELNQHRRVRSGEEDRQPLKGLQSARS